MSMDFTKNKIPSEINITPPYQLMVIHSSKLIYPRELYQRGVQHERVAKIADDFNEYIANEPKVSYRDGKFYMFDGQHTTEGRIERNGGEDLPILCKVYTGLTQEQEALLFAEQTGHSAPLTADHIAAALGISRANAYILLRSDGFPTLHIGKRMVVPKDRFLQWISDSVN